MVKLEPWKTFREKHGDEHKAQDAARKKAERDATRPDREAAAKARKAGERYFANITTREFARRIEEEHEEVMKHIIRGHFLT